MATYETLLEVVRHLQQQRVAVYRLDGPPSPVALWRAVTQPRLPGTDGAVAWPRSMEPFDHRGEWREGGVLPIWWTAPADDPTFYVEVFQKAGFVVSTNGFVMVEGSPRCLVLGTP